MPDTMQDFRRPIWQYLEKIGVTLKSHEHDRLKGLINDYADKRDGAYRKIHEDYIAAHTDEAVKKRQAKARQKRQLWRERRATKPTPTVNAPQV